MKKTTFIICFIILSIFYISAQESDNEDSDVTIEERYLQNVELMLIKEQAFSGTREMKLIALKNIEDMLTSNKLTTGDPDTHYLLNYLAEEGITHITKENNRLVNYFPTVRRKACELLGELGGENSIESLIVVLESDDEPMVLAEAAYALGKIGDNTDNMASKAIAYAILTDDILTPDNNFAYASLLAFEKLSKSEQGISDSVTYRALIQIIQGNYIKAVKNKANDLLDIIRKEK